MRRLVPALPAGALVTSGSPWSTAAPIPEPIQEMHAAVLHGKIYIAGGIDRVDRATAVAYRYDPAANRWERIADLPAPRHHMPLAVAGDPLYAVGGLAETSFVPESNLWIYREDRNRWESRAPLPEPRGASGVGVVNGKLVVVGGWGMRRVLLDSTAIYDPATNRWKHAAPIPRRAITSPRPPRAAWSMPLAGAPSIRAATSTPSRPTTLPATTGRGNPPCPRAGLAAERVDAAVEHGGSESAPPRGHGGVPCQRPLVEGIPHALAAGRGRAGAAPRT